MTQTIAKLKISRPSLKLKAQLRFIGQLVSGNALGITTKNGVATISLALLQLPTLVSFDPSAQSVLLVDGAGNYSVVSVATLLNNSATTVQTVTGAGDIAVGVNTRLLIMNRAVDANPSNIILPASNLKVGKLKIVDFKGNAGTWNHTVKTSGADKFQGGLTQWGIAADGASIELDPIPGTGYAV